MQVIGRGRPWRKRPQGGEDEEANLHWPKIQHTPSRFQGTMRDRTHPQTTALHHDTHNGHSWCDCGAAALNVVATGDLGV